MAKKGEVARASVIAAIEELFKSKGAYETTQDKKIYVWAQDGPGGEKIQYAISLTAPKTPVICGNASSSGDGAWPVATSTTPAAQPASVQLSAEDKAKVDELMAKLGL